MIHLISNIPQTPMSTAKQSSASYPLIFVTHQNLDQSVSWGDDITRLVPDADLTSWSIDNSLSAPVNVAGILNLSTAANIHGQGLFVLYKTTNGISKIYGEFMKPDPQSDSGTMMAWASEVQCPKGMPISTYMPFLLTAQIRNASKHSKMRTTTQHWYWDHRAAYTILAQRT